jgi:hypothetical protein
MGHGTWMTVARVERSEWLCKLPNGLIDVEGTIAYLKMATELVHAASNYVVLDSLQAS